MKVIGGFPDGEGECPGDDCGVLAAPGHLDVGDKQAVRERRNLKLPGHTVTSLCSFVPLWETGGAGPFTLTEPPFRNPGPLLSCP